MKDVKNKTDKNILELEHIDLNLLELINLRTKLVQNNYNSIAKEEMLSKLFDHNQGPLTNEMVKQIFLIIFMAEHCNIENKKETELLIARECKNVF